MGAKRVEFHEGASADAREAVSWYLERSERAALDFLEELRHAIETIQEAPDRWPLGKNDTRKLLLWRFPFSVVYSYSEDMSVVTVWAVAHGSRRPGYWSKRNSG